MPGMGRGLTVEQLHGRLGLSRRSFPPAVAHSGRCGGVGDRLQCHPHDSVPPPDGGRHHHLSQSATVGSRRTPGPPDPPRRLRPAVGRRRLLAVAILHAARPPDERDPADRQFVTGLGPAHRHQRGQHLVAASRAGGRRQRLDPDRVGALAPRGPPGSLVPIRRPGQRRVGIGCLGLRRGLRWDLRPRPHLALRRTGRRVDLLRGGSSGGAARPEVGHPAAPAALCWRPPGSSSSPWRSCRPGRDVATGRGACRRRTTAAPWPAWWPRWPGRRSRAFSPRGCLPSAGSIRRTDGPSTWWS